MTSINTSSSIQSLLQQTRQERFQSADKDGSGGLSLTEFIGGMPQGMANNISTADAQNMFNNMDQDRDGQVTQAEMDAARPKGPPPSMSGLSGSNILQAQDSSDDPLKALLDALKNSASSSQDTEDTDSTDALLKLLDSDEDGSVSKDELSQGFEKIRSEMMSFLLSTQEQNNAAA